MNISGWIDNRRLVPRWRSFYATLRSGELSLPSSSNRIRDDTTPKFLENLELFGMAPSLLTAAEVVQFALVNGNEERAIDAARRILTIDVEAAPLVRAQAAIVLRRAGREEDIPAGVLSDHVFSVSNPRKMTRMHPEDPIAWVELALRQTTAGHGRSAERSMRMALRLAPNNRHVVRSASRLFLHLDDPEGAHSLVVRNAATQSDPWLIAAEIALASVANRPPKFFKVGVKLVESGGVLAHQLTELAGAIGTMDLVDGNRKRSRKMFVQSMSDPTGNALAQGEWASPHFSLEIVPFGRFATVPEAAEAKAFHLYRETKFSDVLEPCREWVNFDPFSIRPFEFGASAAGLAEMYGEAIQFAESGLKLRRDAPLLLNSAAFALASTGKLDEAESKLDCVKESASEIIKNVVLANRGLIAYRRGDIAEGRRFYCEAIDGFKKLGSSRLSANARVYMAREADLANEADAAVLLRQAKTYAEPFLKTEVGVVLDRLEAKKAGRDNPPKLQETSAEKRFDPRGLTWSTPGLPKHLRLDNRDRS